MSLNILGRKIAVMNKRKIWLLFDVIIVLFFLLSISWGITTNGDTSLGVVVFIAIGLFSFTSKIMRSNLIFSRGLYWVLENVFKPRTKFNHIIWGFFFIFVGFAIYISEPLNSTEKELFNSMKKTFEFWLILVLVLAFNILVGLYTAKKHKKNETKSGTSHKAPVK